MAEMDMVQVERQEPQHPAAKAQPAGQGHPMLQMVARSAGQQHLHQLKAIANPSSVVQRQPAPQGGLPASLKSGIESLSGIAMDDVRVHYNSPKPAQLQAHAFAQGTDIHIASGQERHLPHEAWHVVQQKQGRVKPTLQMKGVAINDDDGLEREADVMGDKAMGGGGRERPTQLQTAGLFKQPLAVRQLQSEVVQRAITVTHIDYNPVAAEDERWRDGLIEEGAFYDDLKTALVANVWTGVPNAPFRNQWQNMRDIVEAHNHAAPDIPALGTVIFNDFKAAYQTAGLMIEPRRAQISAEIVAALVENIQEDYQMEFDDAEGGAFDQLIGIAAGNASRAKGVPNSVAAGQLPGDLGGHVTERVAEIAAEKALWNAAVFTPANIRHYFFLAHPNFSSEIMDRQTNLNYREPHSNQAGWLPASAAVTDHVSAARTAIMNAMSPRLKRIMADDDWQDRLGITGPHQVHPNRFRDEYVALRDAHVTPLTDAQVKEAAMGVLCAGASGYLEFNLGGGFSRLVHDARNNRNYVTAHYKWRKGYNPFFRIT